ncbi:15257_t:CDS:2, partial [Racocetra persica]
LLALDNDLKDVEDDNSDSSSATAENQKYLQYTYQQFKQQIKSTHGRDCDQSYSYNKL